MIMMEDLTCLKGMLRNNTYTRDHWSNDCIQIRSSVLNPQNKDEIIFVIANGTLDEAIPILFILNTANNTMKQLT